jgi:hypothetical protein
MILLFAGYQFVYTIPLSLPPTTISKREKKIVPGSIDKRGRWCYLLLSNHLNAPLQGAFT